MKEERECICNSARMKLSCGLVVDIFTESYPQEKKTIARAINCQYLAIASLNDIFHSVDEMTIQSNSLLWKQLLMKNTFVSIAKCDEEDEDNLELGEMIAIEKLKEKLDTKISNRRNIMARELYAMTVRCSPPNDLYQMERLETKLHNKLQKKLRKEEQETKEHHCSCCNPAKITMIDN